MNRTLLAGILVGASTLAHAEPSTRGVTADPPKQRAAAAQKRVISDGDSLGVVAFSRGSTQLGDAALDKVEDIAAWQADHPDSILMIDGYASRGGSSSRNLRITQQRTEVVRDALVEAGADAGRLVLVAHGADRGTQQRAGDRVVVRASVGVPELALVQHDRETATRAARRPTNDTRSTGGAARRSPSGGATSGGGTSGAGSATSGAGSATSGGGTSGAGGGTSGAGSATSGSRAPTGAGSGGTTIVIVPGG